LALSLYDHGPDLVLYYKQLMVLEGNPEYAYQINKSDVLSSVQLTTLTAEWQKFRGWWNVWRGAQ
jgi:hypothetical protein